MKTISLSDINLLDVGNTIGITGSIWTDNNGKSYVVLFPDFTPEEIGELQLMEMSLDDWKAFLRQSDLLEQEILVNDPDGLKKAIVRKSNRMIDTRMQWRCFQRDNYTCRYTGEQGIPLTVDHIDLYEDRGATIDENLLSVSKKANKARGNMPYEVWIQSPAYQRMSRNLSPEVRQANLDILNELPHLRSLRVTRLRSR